MDEPPAIIASPLADVAPLVDVLSEPSLSGLLNTPSSKGYLSHLASLPLGELTQEPVSLQTQSHHLTSSLTSFTHTSYPTFISLHKNTTSFASSIESLSSSLDNLLKTSLPILEESTGVWKGRTSAILRERNKARVVLEQHEKIRDLLDIPVLIDTCVRNGYFGEALSLANHVTSLVHRADGKKNKEAPAVLISVLAEVQYSITQMHLSLLATLYEPNRKLPALWKAVNFLRKMDAFTTDGVSPLGARTPSGETSTRSRPCDPSGEEQLALAFLIGREVCLKTILESTRRDIRRLVKQVDGAEEEGDEDDIDGANKSRPKGKSKEKSKELDERDKEDLARYLKKHIDAWREGVYDIMTQYATIFLERSPAHSEQTRSTDDDEHLLSRLHTLLRTYSTRALSTHLLAILTPSLPLLTLSHLPSLLTQLNYCSTAFSRLGLDFRCILTGGGGLFSNTILTIVKRDFESALEKWITRIEKARGSTSKVGARAASASSSRAAAGPNELPSKWLVSQSAVDTPPLPPSKQAGISGPAHIPPQLLASYPPLAQLTNAVLGVLNGLRLLIPRSTGAANGTTNGGDASMSADGAYELLQMVDRIILDQGSASLLSYLRVVLSSLEGEDAEAGSEKRRIKEREDRIVVAAGKAFFDVFAIFVRRALVEGVYGFKLDGAEKSKGSVKGNGRVSVAGDESWLKSRKAFEALVQDISGEEEDGEEDQGNEEDDDDDEGSSEGSEEGDEDEGEEEDEEEEGTEESK